MNRAQLTAAKDADRYSRIAYLLRTTCPYCHAPAGEPCRTNSGNPIWQIPQCTMPASRPRAATTPRCISTFYALHY